MYFITPFREPFVTSFLKNFAGNPMIAAASSSVIHVLLSFVAIVAVFKNIFNTLLIPIA